MSGKEQNVACSFCNENHPSTIIGDHLMVCGNKTDQCPNCKKYIRRAVFAYHYENSCANIEESNANGNSSTLTAATSRDKTTSVPQTNNRSSNHPNIVICQFCYQECELDERPMHEERCLQNPKNRKNTQSSHIYPNLAQDVDQVQYRENLRGNDIIPCELCGRYIVWHSFRIHMESCVEQERQRLANLPRSNNNSNNPHAALCKYCRKPVSSFLKLHEITCSQHPRRLAFDRWIAADHINTPHGVAPGYKPIL